MEYRTRLFVLVLFLSSIPDPSWGTVYMTVPQALEKFFPPPITVEEKRAIFLDEQTKEIQKILGADEELDSRLVTYFIAKKGNQDVGRAYIDTHLVRTLKETIMIVVGTDEKIEGIQVLSFNEPPDYLAPGRWMEQFNGRSLETASKKDIHSITGASLTARSVTKSVRKILAIHKVLMKKAVP